MYPLCKILFISAVKPTAESACFKCSADFSNGSWALFDLNDFTMVLTSFRVTGSIISSCCRAIDSISNLSKVT